jgi:hypothetical protein
VDLEFYWRVEKPIWKLRFGNACQEYHLLARVEWELAIVRHDIHVCGSNVSIVVMERDAQNNNYELLWPVRAVTVGLLTPLGSEKNTVDMLRNFWSARDVTVTQLLFTVGWVGFSVRATIILRTSHSRTRMH